MNYAEWVSFVPKEIRGGVLWTVEAYRLGLFAADVAWHDVTKLMQDKRTLDLSDQLYRAVGSVSANIAEGYSRGSNKDRVRFYEYALGSARESRDWIYKGRHVLGNEVAVHRLRLFTQLIRLLLTMIPEQRANRIREAQASYTLNIAEDQLRLDKSVDRVELAALLESIPLP